MTTVKQLREALDQLGPGYDDTEVLVWLPGRTIELQQMLIVNTSHGKILIEGNDNG